MQFGIASSTRTTASSLLSERSTVVPGGGHIARRLGPFRSSRSNAIRHSRFSYSPHSGFGRPADSRLKGFAMDTVASIAQRREELATSAVATATIDANRTLTVTGTYLLSEDGQKASLLMGGDGRAVQQLSVNVPTNRLHLVSVDADGVARLKLRPRYETDGEQQRLVRIDAPPTYDSPPDIEALFREAARNHQLERA